MIFSSLLLKGILIGFTIAMPVGPIGLLCIRNALTYGMVCGLITGLGAAFADAIYGAIAGFGITMISDFFTNHNALLRILGAFFLCYLGLTTLTTKSKKNETSSTSSHRLVFFSTFLLTLTNPMTILSFAAIYAGLGIGTSSAEILPAALMTLGVFVGSVLWWILLSVTAAAFKEKISEEKSLWINRISGAILLSFGLFAAFI